MSNELDSTLEVAKAYVEQHIAATAAAEDGTFRLALDLLFVPNVARPTLESWPEVWLTVDQVGALTLWNQEPQIWRAPQLGFPEDDGWYIDEGLWSSAGYLNGKVRNWRDCKMRLR